jgi:hypothetical protein
VGQNVLKRGLQIAIKVEPVFSEALHTGRQVRAEERQVFFADTLAFGPQVGNDRAHIEDILQDHRGSQ